jgi:hypothetical protein
MLCKPATNSSTLFFPYFPNYHTLVRLGMGLNHYVTWLLAGRRSKLSHVHIFPSTRIVEAKAALLVILFCMLTQWERICRAHWLLESAEIFGNNERACCGHFVRNSVIACYLHMGRTSARSSCCFEGQSRLFANVQAQCRTYTFASDKVNYNFKEIIIAVISSHAVNANEVLSWFLII